MKSFREYLEESEELDWDGNPKIGYWKDNDDQIMYHGTHKKNLLDILKGGLNKPDPKTGMISLTHDPNTAHGYAAMSGESDFRQAGKKAQNVPHEDRVVLKVKLPKDFVDNHHDKSLSGNIGDASRRLSDKSAYDNFNGRDSEYYQTSELRFNEPIKPEHILGFMFKKK